MNAYPHCQVGPYYVNNVGFVHRTVVEAPEGVPGAYAMEQITFYRDGDTPPPEIPVPGEYEIIVEGKSLGVKRVCCTGRDPSDGGYVTVKWRLDEQA